MTRLNITPAQKKLLEEYYKHYSKSSIAGSKLINRFVRSVLRNGYYEEHQRTILNSIRKDTIENIRK